MRRLKHICSEADKVYGKVIEKCFMENKGREFGFTDAVILGLMENLINHSSSIMILLEKNHHSSLDTILRTLFENYVFLNFVLEKDTDRRALSYAYSNKLKEIKLYNQMTEDSLRGHELRKHLNVKKDEVISQFNDGLSEDYRSQINEVYLKELGMRRLDQKWYNLDGSTKTFKLLCEKLNFSVEYELLYTILSTEVHGKNAIKNFQLSKNRVDLLKAIRDKEIYIVTSGLFLLRSIKMVYKYYQLKKELRQSEALLAIKYKY